MRFSRADSEAPKKTLGALKIEFGNVKSPLEPLKIELWDNAKSPPESLEVEVWGTDRPHGPQRVEFWDAKNLLILQKPSSETPRALSKGAKSPLEALEVEL